MSQILCTLIIYVNLAVISNIFNTITHSHIYGCVHQYYAKSKSEGGREREADSVCLSARLILHNSLQLLIGNTNNADR